MPELTCDELKIPHRLRQNGKEVVESFEEDVFVYRWFKPFIDYEFEGQISTAAVGEVFRPPYDISVNRSHFCQTPKDVLYNPFRLPHRFDHGVMEASVSQVNEKTFQTNTGDSVKFYLEHKPETCMYPHSQIVISVNGERVENEIKNKLLKADIRDELRSLFTVCHAPDPHLVLE